MRMRNLGVAHYVYAVGVGVGYTYIHTVVGTSIVFFIINYIASNSNHLDNFNTLFLIYKKCIITCGYFFGCQYLIAFLCLFWSW